MTVGHGGKENDRQIVDDDVVENTSVDEFKDVVISEISTNKLQ